MHIDILMKFIWNIYLLASFVKQIEGVLLMGAPTAGL
jgi:hypothetical protein